MRTHAPQRRKTVSTCIMLASGWLFGACDGSGTPPVLDLSTESGAEIRATWRSEGARASGGQINGYRDTLVLMGMVTGGTFTLKSIVNAPQGDACTAIYDLAGSWTGADKKLTLSASSATYATKSCGGTPDATMKLDAMMAVPLGLLYSGTYTLSAEGSTLMVADQQGGTTYARQ